MILDLSNTVPASMLLLAFYIGTFFILYFIITNSLNLLFLVLSFTEIRRFFKRVHFRDYERIMQSDMATPISIIMPVYNKEEVICDSINSILNLRYPKYEIIVVNDGSTDQTLEVVENHFKMQKVSPIYRHVLQTLTVNGIYRSAEYPNLIVVDKERGGKSDSLNAGINIAHYGLVAPMDSDTVLELDSLLKVVRPYEEDPDRTIAVGGIVNVANGCEIVNGNIYKVGLSKRQLPRFQAIEYLRTFIFGHIGWGLLRSVLLTSCSFCLFRKQALVEVGGYRSDIEGGDIELAVRIHRHMRERGWPYRIVFVPDSICWAKVPENTRGLKKQRSIWQKGRLQGFFKHVKMFFNPRYGTIGLLGFPYFVLFETLGPALETLGYLFVIGFYLFGLLSTTFLLMFFSVSIVYGILLSISALLLEEISYHKYTHFKDVDILCLYGILDNLGYRQLVAWWSTKAFLVSESK